MKRDNHRFELNYSTAPTLRDPENDGKMLPIQLELPRSGLYDASKIYRRILAGKISGDNSGDFRKWLPQFLAGKDSDTWILWHVQIRPQQLQLLFTRRYPLLSQEHDESMDLFRCTGTSNINIAQLTLTAPVGIVCDFTIPAMLDQPEKCVRYNFVRYEDELEAGTEWCQLRVVEVIGEQVQFRQRLRMRFAGIRDPEPESESE